MKNTALFAKFSNLRTVLKATFIERENVIDGSLAAVLAGEHVLAIGVPGSGKSAIVRAIAQSVSDSQYFEWLLGKFTLPDELFGSLDLQALEQGRYERVLTKKLPQAHWAFLDECFKSNSAVLNALLAILNERAFDNGTQRISCPLISCFGASNELPEGKELEAIFDRFLVRFEVKYISDRDALKGMLLAGKPQPMKPMLSLDDVKEAQAEVRTIQLPDTTIDLVLEAKEKLERAGIVASDRRWQQVLGLLRAVAWLDGSDEVLPEHLEILSDVLWRETKERAAICQLISQLANPLAAKANEILDAAKDTFKTALAADPTNRASFLATTAEANATLEKALGKLRDLVDSENPNKSRKVNSAIVEVTKMHSEIGRKLGEVLGIKVG